MIKIHFLGTCSGTEPMPDMHHSSYVIEYEDRFYWLDAGENCIHRAYTSGLDVMKTEAVFITHPHIDHVGGLANMLHCFEKLVVRGGKRFDNGNSLPIYFPESNVFSAVLTIAKSKPATVKDFHFDLIHREVGDGVIFDNGSVRVTAQHNTHLGIDEESQKHAFSYLFELGGKRVVASGDVRSPSELKPLLLGGCDLLIMETGHHKVSDVLDFAKEEGVGSLIFTHHGREMLERRAECEEKIAAASAASGIPMYIAFDGMDHSL